MISIVDRQQVQRLIEEGAQIVEVLPASSYRMAHLPTARCFPLRRFYPDMLDLDQSQPVVVYCYDYTDLSARAAARLETLGFQKIYHYAAGKVDWMAANLPWDGGENREAHVGVLAHEEVPTCKLTDRADHIKSKLDKWPACVVVNDHNVVLGLVRRERVQEETSRRAADMMEPGPPTVRPHTSAAGAHDRMQDHDLSLLLVTSGDGVLLGAVLAPEVAARAQQDFDS